MGLVKLLMVIDIMVIDIMGFGIGKLVVNLDIVDSLWDP